MPRKTGKPSALFSGTHEMDEDTVSIMMHERFEQGDQLAPFHWAYTWKIGLCSGPMPRWVAEYFATLAADYDQGAREARREGEKPKTLDELAGLSHIKPNPWKAADRRYKAILLKHFFESIVRAARSGRQDTALVMWQEGVAKFTDGRCSPVAVLDGRGRPTRDFQIALGLAHGFTARAPATTKEGREAIYRAVRQLLTEAEAALTGHVEE